MFQEQNRRDRDLRPSFYRWKLLKAVLSEAQRALQLLEEQLSVPVIIPPKITFYRASVAAVKWFLFRWVSISE